jgi:hypothetical protein
MNGIVVAGCSGFVSSVISQNMGAEAISMYRLAMAGEPRQRTPTKLQRPVRQQHSSHLGQHPGHGGGHA